MPIVNPSGSPIVPATLAMVTVSLYSDVRALIAGQASMVHVLGGSAVGDGQDGIFYWNSTSTAADDGFATLAPNLGGTGRWIRLYSSFSLSSGAAHVGFSQSGTGALTSTVSAALRARAVHTSEFDTNPHYVTARDALTGTLGVNALDVGINGTTSVVNFPARTAGRGSGIISSFDNSFNGTPDPTLFMGIGATGTGGQAVVSEPFCYFAMEANYNDGSGANKMEMYWQWSGLPSQASKTYRPFFSQANRTTGAYQNVIAGDLTQFKNNDATTSIIDVYPTQILAYTTLALSTLAVSASAGISVADTTPRSVTLSPSLGASGLPGLVTAGVYGLSLAVAGIEIVRLESDVASVVNRIEMRGGATGLGPSIAANGETNVPLNFYSHGTGAINLRTNFSPIQCQIEHTASAANYPIITGAAAGANASIRPSAENLLFGSGSALATTATAGYVMFPSCAGTPTGVPTGQAAGKIPMIFDTTGVKLWFYTGGAWKGVVVA